MILLRLPRRVIFFLLLAFVLSGCLPPSSQTVDEEKEHYFVKGQTLLSSMDYDGAIQSFEKALEVNPRSAAAHLQLGELYMQRRGDHAVAIYHFEQHLRLRPASPMADVIRGWVTACKMELAKSLSIALRTPQLERGFEKELIRLTDENRALKDQVEQLKAQLAQRFAQLPPTRQTPENRPQPPIATPDSKPEPGRNLFSETPKPQPRATLAPPRTNDISRTPPPSNKPKQPDTRLSGITILGSYTVQRSDSFASIARKFGVDPQRLQLANPDASPKKLRAGQVLKIPSRKG